MPVFLTVAITKFILKFNRVFGIGGGSALPGLIAEKIDPNILRKLAKRIPKDSVLITGTNGKTTTTKMAAEILRQAGLKPVTNSGGSNLSRGVLSTLIERSRVGLLGQVRLGGDVGLFEVDEAAMPAVASAIKPSVIVVLNLHRDQLDRYGELDRTASLIGGAIAATSAKVYLNADDPLVASLAKYSRKPDKVKFFGVEDSASKKLASDHTADSIHCPVCGKLLSYSKEFFAHIGHYSCPSRDFKRPKVQIGAGKSKSVGTYSQHFDVTLGDQKSKLHLQVPGLYNVYNGLGAIAAADGMGIKLHGAAIALEKVAAAFGRVERIEVDGKFLFLLLIKNPTGFNQIIQTFLTGTKSKNVLLAINDNFADGRDVSWLWDAGLEELAGKPIEIVTSGSRAYDMALRLKYTQIKSEPVQGLEAGVERFLSKVKKGETAYILPTYTAMLAIRKLLARRAGLGGFWQ